MAAIKFDKDFNVKEAKIYDKNSNTWSLQRNGVRKCSLLGKLVKYTYGELIIHIHKQIRTLPLLQFAIVIMKEERIIRK
jgi:hypothetical protein